METVKIEFVEFENAGGVFAVQQDASWASVGDWQVCFFATLWPNPQNRLFSPLRLNVVRVWRFAESVGDRRAMLAELKKRARLCDYCKVEIFSVSRVEMVNAQCN